MNDRTILEIEHALSKARLHPYRSGDGSENSMLANYLWNIELSKSLVPILHAAEIALRNAIHTTLTDHHDTEDWFYVPGLIEPQQLSAFASARSCMEQKYKGSVTVGHVIAELNFGFWVWLLSGKHEQRIWQADGFALTHAVFPYAGRVSHQHIHQRFDAIRALRNRVAHLEAIWTYPDLPRRHADVIEAVGWICPPLARSVAIIDTFDDAYRSRVPLAKRVARLD